MKKINIANILKDYPSGTLLYSPLCGECTFNYINFGTIICRRPNDQVITFTSEGYYMLPSNDDCECMLFPSKENRDWKTFKRPEFKNGDVIVSAYGSIALFSHTTKSVFECKDCVYYHCLLNLGESLKIKNDCGIGYTDECTLATAAQKKKLFKAIKEAGYEWDSKEGVLKPTLKAILKTFKKGDCIKVTFPEGNHAVAIVDSIKDYTINVKCSTFDSGNTYEEGVLTKRDDIKVQEATKEQKAYLLDIVYEQYRRTWNEETKELESPKFDFTSFKPFDKVLVRDCVVGRWRCDLFSHFNRDDTHRRYHLASNESAKYCIPYNDDTNYLVGSNLDAPEYYNQTK
jgi:hypothetical protein